MAVAGGVLVAVAALVIVFLVSGRGGGSAATTFATTTTAETTTTNLVTTTTTEPPTTTETTATGPFSGDAEPKSGAAQGIPYGTLTGVRTAQHDGYSRLVFDFGGTDGVPAYDVRYQTGPFHDIADREVAVAGAAFLVVHLRPAMRADLNHPDAPLTYAGPLRFDPGAASVAEVVFLEDFEGEMIWVVGLTAPKPFAVGTLTHPPRIYLDIAD